MRARPVIVMVSGNAPPMMDGVGDCTDRLIAELVRQRPGWRWVWVCRRPRWFHSPLVKRGRLTLLRPSHGWGALGRTVVSTVAAGLMPDLVHIQEQIHSFHETDAAVRIALKAKAAGARVVTTLHEYHIERPSVVHTTNLVRLSDFVIANDPRNAQRCLSETGREPDASWWSGSTVLPPEPAVRAPTTPGLLATFGFISGLKLLEPVAAALTILRAEFPDIRWRVIGPFDPASNPDHAALMQRVGPLGVEFTGGFSVHDPRLQTLLAEAAIMVLPFADGASERRTSLHAAWAFGLPVVTTPPPTAATTIADGENCLLVTEPTATAWANALRRVLTDSQLAETLRAGSLKAAERFSWERLAAEHLKVYEMLLNST